MSDEMLHDYFDEELPPEERARFERALAADPGLVERLRELSGIDAALGTLPGHVAPPGFTARVVRATRRRRHVVLRFAVPLAAAAAVALVVFLDRPSRPAPVQEATAYIWESDVETYGSLALTDLEDQILEEIEGT